MNPTQLLMVLLVTMAAAALAHGGPGNVRGGDGGVGRDGGGKKGHDKPFNGTRPDHNGTHPFPPSPPNGTFPDDHNGTWPFPPNGTFPHHHRGDHNGTLPFDNNNGTLPGPHGGGPGPHGGPPDNFNPRGGKNGKTAVPTARPSTTTTTGKRNDKAKKP